MQFLLATALAILSLVGYADAYRYVASPKRTGRTAVTGLFVLVFLILAALCVRVLAIARGHRTPYAILLVALILEVFGLSGSIAYDLLIANRDFRDNIPGDAFPATIAITTLFTNWNLALVFLAFAHLIKVRADNVIRSFSIPDKRQPGLSRVWTFAYLSLFTLIVIFGTAAAGVIIDLTRDLYTPGRFRRPGARRNSNQSSETYRDLTYTYSAIWYASAILLGALAFVAYRTAQRLTSIYDKILKTLLFVAFPIHVTHVVAQIIFTILNSPSGLQRTNEIVDNLSLSDTIVSLILHAATIGVLIIVGLRRANWNQGGMQLKLDGRPITHRGKVTFQVPSNK